MNILFLVNNTKISPNANGGASVYYSHLELLHKAGYSVHIMLMDWETSNAAEISKIEDSEHLTEVNSFYTKVHHFKVCNPEVRFGLNRIKNALFFPGRFEYFFVNEENAVALRNHCENNKIDLVWSEWRWAAIIAQSAKLNVPTIYAHHDWEYKLGSLRTEKTSLAKKLHRAQKKRVELGIIQCVSGCVSGSFTETEEIKALGNKNAVYLPLTYNEVSISRQPSKVPSIVHLGGMGTTANRIGLERFLKVCWNDIKQQLPNVQLKIIGSLKHGSEYLLNSIENDPQIVSLGFVEDLDGVLLPYDIHIIPWEHNTGTRTRIPLIFNYNQVLVATKAAAACYPEVIHNQNSSLAENLEEMSDQIIDLYSNQEKRIFIGDNGRETFKEHFVSEQQIEKLKTFINSVYQL